MDAQHKMSHQSGSVIFYIFLAVGLLGLLTYSLTQSSRTSATTQSAFRITEDLFVQSNAIKSAVLECTFAFPNGGGDLDGNGTINSADNDNVPYPLSPTDANNPDGAAANDQVRNLQCPGAPAGQRSIYDGVGTTGRFLPPASNGFGEWTYINDTNGVRLQIIGPNDQAALQAMDALERRFDTCEADIDFSSCGATCFTTWIIRATCP